MKVSETDYKTQKEMLTKYIGQHIIYQGKMYTLVDFFEYSVNDKPIVESVLSLGDKKSITVSITEIFKICYPTVIVA